MVAFTVMKMRRGQAMMDFGPFIDMLFADANGKFRQRLSPWSWRKSYLSL